MTAYAFLPGAVQSVHEFNIPGPVLLSVLENPTRVQRDRTLSRKTGMPHFHKVERRSRGDITAVVGLRVQHEPMVLWVEVHSRDEDKPQRHSGPTRSTPPKRGNA